MSKHRVKITLSSLILGHDLWCLSRTSWQMTLWLITLTMALFCPRKSQQCDIEPAWTKPGPWNWSSEMECSRHQFYTSNPETDYIHMAAIFIWHHNQCRKHKCWDFVILLCSAFRAISPSQDSGLLYNEPSVIRSPYNKRIQSMCCIIITSLSTSIEYYQHWLVVWYMITLIRILKCNLKKNTQWKFSLKLLSVFFSTI